MTIRITCIATICSEIRTIVRCVFIVVGSCLVGCDAIDNPSTRSIEVLDLGKDLGFGRSLWNAGSSEYTVSLLSSSGTEDIRDIAVGFVGSQIEPFVVRPLFSLDEIVAWDFFFGAESPLFTVRSNQIVFPDGSIISSSGQINKSSEEATSQVFDQMASCIDTKGPNDITPFTSALLLCFNPLRETGIVDRADFADCIRDGTNAKKSPVEAFKLDYMFGCCDYNETAIPDIILNSPSFTAQVPVRFTVTSRIPNSPTGGNAPTLACYSFVRGEKVSSSVEAGWTANFAERLRRDGNTYTASIQVQSPDSSGASSMITFEVEPFSISFKATVSCPFESGCAACVSDADCDDGDGCTLDECLDGEGTGFTRICVSNMLCPPERCSPDTRTCMDENPPGDGNNGTGTCEFSDAACQAFQDTVRSFEERGQRRDEQGSTTDILNTIVNEHACCFADFRFALPSLGGCLTAGPGCEE